MTTKPVSVLILFALLFAFSCKKDNNSNSLTGKWKLVGSYYSIGGPEQFNGTVNGDVNQYVKFDGSGQIESDYFTGATTYKLSGTNTVIINFKGQTTAQGEYSYNIKHDTLNLANKGCIEGCAIIFMRE